MYGFCTLCYKAKLHNWVVEVIEKKNGECFCEHCKIHHNRKTLIWIKVKIW